MVIVDRGGRPTKMFIAAARSGKDLLKIAYIFIPPI